MMILPKLWLILSLLEAAPVKEAPKEDIVTDDIQSVDTVNDDGMDSDELHSHTSRNTSRDAKHIFHGGNINFNGTINSSGDHAHINIGSISSNALSQEPHDEPDSQAIDGGWTSFGECTKTCEGGVQTRTCTDPPPQQGGKLCTGDHSQPCNAGVKCTDTVCEKDEISKTDCSCENPTGNVVSVCSAGQRCTEDGTCSCKDEEFACSSGKCINKFFRCDAKSDCDDGSDEMKCEDATVCKKDKRSKTACSCDNPTGNRVSVCSRGQRCTEDGTCQDGCMPGQFPCDDGIQCVKQSYRCDGDEPDCTDGSDEKDCTNTEKRRKRSTQTLTVRGKIVLPANMDFTFPTNSRVNVSCDDISNQQSTNLGIAVIDVSNKPSEEDISYVLEADLPNSERINLAATINVGWNRDTNSEEWIRKGDFHNDVSYSLYVVKDTAEYEKDISVVLYN